MNWNELSKAVHQNAIEKGFWNEPKSDGHCFMLVITEVAEAVEADRKRRRANVVEFTKPEILPASVVIQNAHFINRFEKYIKDTVEDEFADIAIRLLDLAKKRKTSLESNMWIFQDFPETFAEQAFAMCGNITCTAGIVHTQIRRQLSFLICWAKHLGIDLEFHIEQKMKYNSMREFMHGKAY